MDIFNAIHSSGKIFDSERKLFDFVKTTGIEFDSYEKTFRSIEIESEIQKANQMARRLKSRRYLHSLCKENISSRQAEV